MRAGMAVPPANTMPAFPRRRRAKVVAQSHAKRAKADLVGLADRGPGGGEREPFAISPDMDYHLHIWTHGRPASGVMRRPPFPWTSGPTRASGGGCPDPRCAPSSISRTRGA